MMSRENIGAELHSVLIAVHALKSGKLANDVAREACAAPAEAIIAVFLQLAGYTVENGILVDHRPPQILEVEPEPAQATAEPVKVEPAPPADAPEHASFATPEDI